MTVIQPKREPFAWIPAEIRSYKALYKGRRYWLFENDFTRPYDLYTDEKYHQLLLYDNLADTISGSGYWANDGQIHGCSFWGQGIDFIVSDPAGMVSEIRNIDSQMG